MDCARGPSHATQQRIRTDPHPEPTREPLTGLATQREANQMERLIEAERAPSMGGDDPRQTFTEDLLRTRRVQTAEATGMQPKLHGDPLPREICHGTHIATMYPT
jgi:hypothetical protein